MQVRGLTESDIRAAALDAGVRLVNFRPQGRGFAFTLGLQGELWRRLSHEHPNWTNRNGTPYKPRKIAAVCFHGHAAFMQRVFDANPDAVIISAMARFDGVAAFQAEACNVGERNVGSDYYPQEYNRACTCAESGNRELTEGARV